MINSYKVLDKRFGAGHQTNMSLVSANNVPMYNQLFLMLFLSVLIKAPARGTKF